MQKNQKNTRTKKYRRDLNHAEFLDNIEFFSIILKNQIILVYDPPADYPAGSSFGFVCLFFA